MIVSNCPRCGEAFRIPAGELPDDGYAQCPWCRDTFPVTDVLKLLPPVLELLTADGKPFVPAAQPAALGVAGAESLNFQSPSTAETVVDDDTSESFDFRETAPHDVVEGDLEQPGKDTLTAATVTDESWSEPQGELASDDHLAEFEVEDRGDAWQGDQPSLSYDELAPMKVSPAPARKSKGGGIGTAIKVVLGGVLAVPLAGGLLMAMGRNPDWGFWPFNGSGESTRNVVAAPPAKLSTRRATRATDNQPSGRMLNPDLGNDALSVPNDPTDSAREQIMAAPKVEDLSPIEELELPPADSPIVLPNANELANEPNLADRAASEDSAADDSAADVDPTFNAPTLEMPMAAADEPENSRSEKPGVEAPLAESEAAEPIPAVQSATADDSAELVAIADRAGKMVDALSTYDGDPEERVRRMLLTYEKIAIACNLASSNSKALDSLASKLRNSSLLDEIVGMAPQWLVYSSRRSEGIVLVGQASSSRQGQIITLDSGAVLSVVGDMQPPAAERVLAMGRIIDENSVELVLAQAVP